MHFNVVFKCQYKYTIINKLVHKLLDQIIIFYVFYVTKYYRILISDIYHLLGNKIISLKVWAGIIISVHPHLSQKKNKNERTKYLFKKLLQ